jgi:prolyl oligopeptidase
MLRIFFALLLFSTSYLAMANCDDPLVWLETSSPRTSQFVTSQNQRALSEIAAIDSAFTEVKGELLQAFLSQDKLQAFTMRGHLVTNLYTDVDHPKGQLRVAKIEDLFANTPQWEVVLDIDKLNTDEDSKWVFKGLYCMPKNLERCMISLSDRGSDSVVIREFNLITKQFVKGGFEIPFGKSFITWIDENTLWVSSSVGENATTQSGYARQVRVLKRGEKFEQAKVIFEVDESYLSVATFRVDGERQPYFFIVAGKSFYDDQYILVKNIGEDQYQFQNVSLPDGAEFLDVFSEQVIFRTRRPIILNHTHYPAGTVISYPMDQLSDPFNKDESPECKILFQPSAQQAYAALSVSQGTLYIQYLDNVNGRLRAFTFLKNEWRQREIEVPEHRKVSVNSNSSSPLAVIQIEGIVEPINEFVIKDGDKNLTPFRQAPALFDAQDVVVEQKFAVSTDGTLIPYFIAYKKQKSPTTRPTLLFAYGGFEFSLLPSYQIANGKAWIEKGGVFVMANIRGGGELGPSWHQAALKENRQTSFNDFAAVAESLIHSNVTTPQQLGIISGSNGGLLVSIVALQHPELFKAVVANVPLTDMLRFDLHGAGRSWIAEYGDPQIERDRVWLRRFSPYHNVTPADKNSPSFLITSSTADNRVHPSHARKFAHRLIEQGYNAYLYEPSEGGHEGSDGFQQAQDRALQFTFLAEQLGLY